MAPKPDIVIIPGSWHTPASYTALRTALESAAFAVHIPPLTTITDTSKPATGTLSTDSASIRAYVTTLSDAGINTIILCHSYGGMVATNALSNLSRTQRAKSDLPGGILELVYMGGISLRTGESMNSLVASHGHTELLHQIFEYSNDGCVAARDPRAVVVGPGLSEEGLGEYLGSWRRFAAEAWDGRVGGTPAWMEVPVTKIVCTLALTVPVAYEEGMIEGMRREGVEPRVVEIETGHCPNVTRTGEIVEALKTVAEKYMEI